MTTNIPPAAIPSVVPPDPDCTDPYRYIKVEGGPPGTTTITSTLPPATLRALEASAAARAMPEFLGKFPVKEDAPVVLPKVKVPWYKRVWRYFTVYCPEQPARKLRILVPHEKHRAALLIRYDRASDGQHALYRFWREAARFCPLTRETDTSWHPELKYVATVGLIFREIDLDTEYAVVFDLQDYEVIHCKEQP